LALAYLGDIAMRRKDFATALGLLKKAVGLKSDIRIAYLDMGAIFAEQKHFEDALAALHRAAEVDPTEADVHYRLGRVYQTMGKRAESQKEFAKVRQMQQRSQDDLVRKMAAAPPAIGDAK